MQLTGKPMASENITVKKDWLPAKSKTDWMLANPWLWYALGFVFTLWSWLWTITRGELASDNRVIVLAAGLLCGGVGLWLRWNDRQSLYLRSWQAPVALGLGIFFALSFLGVTLVFFASFFVEASIGLKSAPLFLVWLTTGPLTFFAARRCLSRKPEESDEHTLEEEVGLAFVGVGGLCVLGSFTLYADRSTPTDWDTMRLFLRVCTAVSMGGGALVLVSKALRRMILSGIFFLHFVAINTAALSAHPSPWIVQQVWMRLFRPYLQFVYLNNAYHFYAPEPGPASNVWFRIIYENPQTQDQEGMWFKIPQLDDGGHIKHPVALLYQRELSLTEAVVHSGGLPSETYYDEKRKDWYVRPIYKDRLDLVLPFNEPVTNRREGKHVRIPLHPDLTYMQQVFIPSGECMRMLSSYARHVAQKFAVHPDPEKSDWQFKSVKIYRVVHWIPHVSWLTTNVPPTDPFLYRPYYVGNFNAEGMVTEYLGKNPDPFLYWLLPSMREEPMDPDSQIYDFARRHAGDSHWVRRGSDKKWVKWEDRDPPRQQ